MGQRVGIDQLLIGRPLFLELLERCLSPFAALPPGRATAVSARSLMGMARARAAGGHGERLRVYRPEHPAVTAARERRDA